MAVLLVRYFRGPIILLICASGMGCAYMNPSLEPAPEPARVIVCKGSGAYASCRPVDSDSYRAFLKSQGRLTGTRINPDPVSRRVRSSI